MAYPKITNEMLEGKGVTGLPDTPNLTKEEMQTRFDEIPLLIADIFNQLSTLLDSDVGDSIKGVGGINAIRINNNQIQFSYDGGQTWGTTSTEITVVATPDSIQMANYSEPAITSPIIASNNLNQAIGKLERKADNNASAVAQLTPMTQAAYDALSTKQQRLYFTTEN